MYAIKLLFKSDVKDIYTMWEETADNEFFFHLKLDRMINHWLRILVEEQVVIRTNIEYENDIYSDDKLSMIRKKYLMIQRQIDIMNHDGIYGQNRDFSIRTFQGENHDKLMEFKLL